MALAEYLGLPESVGLSKPMGLCKPVHLSEPVALVESADLFESVTLIKLQTTVSSTSYDAWVDFLPTDNQIRRTYITNLKYIGWRIEEVRMKNFEEFRYKTHSFYKYYNNNLKKYHMAVLMYNKVNLFPPSLFHYRLMIILKFFDYFQVVFCYYK